jgi:hypothetical protein
VRTVIIIKYLVLDLFDLLQRRVMFLPQKWCVDDILYTLKEIFIGRGPLLFAVVFIGFFSTLSRRGGQASSTPNDTERRKSKREKRYIIASHTDRNSRRGKGEGVGAE